MADYNLRFTGRRLSLVEDVGLARASRGLAEVVVNGSLPADRALEAERLRREAFVATLAHELRQPLSALLAAVEVLRLAPGGEDRTRATAIMKRQIGQMARSLPIETPRRSASASAIPDAASRPTRWAISSISTRS